MSSSQPQDPMPKHQGNAAPTAHEPKIHGGPLLHTGSSPSPSFDASFGSELPQYLSWPPWEEDTIFFQPIGSFRGGHSHSSSGGSGSHSFDHSLPLDGSFYLQTNNLTETCFQPPLVTSPSELEKNDDLPEGLERLSSRERALQTAIKAPLPRKDDPKQKPRTSSERTKTTRERISFGRQRRSVKEQLLKALEDIERKNEENSQLQREIAALRREVEILREMMPLRESVGGLREH